MLNRPSPVTVGALAESLAMDQTTISANLKPLERRRLVSIRRAEADARVKHVVLTGAGRTLLAKAVKHWQVVNDSVKASINRVDLPSLYSSLATIAEAGR
jgi:DNA-binding MarR family transcriptional regulator